MLGNSSKLVLLMFLLYVFPMKPTVYLSNFFLSKFYLHNYASSIKAFPVKHLCATHCTTTSMWTSYVIVIMWVWVVARYVAIPDVLGLRPKGTHIKQIKSSHITNNYVTFSLLRSKETIRGYISYVCLIPGIQVIVCYCPGQCTFRCNTGNLCTSNKHYIIIQVDLS